MSGSPISYIAVVDDDESLCRSLSRLLRAKGFQAVTYSSGEVFLADTKRPKFDCLVLDIQFDGMSGIELQKQLVAGGSKVPIIFITAHDDPAVREEAIAAGCKAFFHKTDPGDAVLAVLATICETSA